MKGEGEGKREEEGTVKIGKKRRSTKDSEENTPIDSLQYPR